MTPPRNKLSVPLLARHFGVAESKIYAWIRSGELRAINLARSTQGRPRYAIDVADIDAFEQARTVVTAVGSTRRLPRRTTAKVKEFF